MGGGAWLVLAAALAPYGPDAWAAQAAKETCAADPKIAGSAMLQRGQRLSHKSVVSEVSLASQGNTSEENDYLGAEETF
eukprot:CAMPEP_0179144498 /NCGR_PEP_ID=MMETSP0796-20121207/69625_1 /TAXON_ID=73915 /ORGANISM="Pyrodinium bahamense, Strain pbaha01" /LENGTH=78 /DNA_ID=CAMNT_0020844739 /DNA_START=1 /DNA_END=234 /DNA_ORIENTATION=+